MRTKTPAILNNEQLDKNPLHLLIFKPSNAKIILSTNYDNFSEMSRLVSPRVYEYLSSALFLVRCFVM